MDDDKFFSRLLSKDTSIANPSFRVYHGGLSGTVPFTWESQPGTPKHPSSHSSLPPLTPPPSFYSTSTKKPINTQSRSNLFHSFWFLKPSMRKTHVSLSSSSSSSSSSASSRSRSRSKFSSRGSSFDSRMEYEEEEGGSPTSILCFGIGKGVRSHHCQ